MAPNITKKRYGTMCSEKELVKKSLKQIRRSAKFPRELESYREITPIRKATGNLKKSFREYFYNILKRKVGQRLGSGWI